MSTPSPPSAAQSSRELIRLARQGDSRALADLFARQGGLLRRWASGRLPTWGRRAMDTNDLVQEALIRTFRRISRFEDRGRGALQAYLREAVRNRIRDELRRVNRQPPSGDLEDTMPDAGESPFDATADSEVMRRYKEKLALLTETERFLVVGRIEMAYTYEQLALATGRETAGAARIAVRRAVLRLAKLMAP